MKKFIKGAFELDEWKLSVLKGEQTMNVTTKKGNKMSRDKQMTLGKYLKKARDKKGLSVRELAKLGGVAHTTIYKYETDEHEPRISHLKWIAQALGLTLTELIERI